MANKHQKKGKKNKKRRQEEEDEEEQKTEAEEDEEQDVEEEQATFQVYNPLTPLLIRKVFLPPPEKAQQMMVLEVYVYMQRRAAVAFLVCTLLFSFWWNIWPYTLPFAVQELALVPLGREPSMNNRGSSILFCSAAVIAMAVYTMPLLIYPFLESWTELAFALAVTLLWFVGHYYLGWMMAALVKFTIVFSLTMERDSIVMSVVRTGMLTVFVLLLK